MHYIRFSAVWLVVIDILMNNFRQIDGVFDKFLAIFVLIARNINDGIFIVSFRASYTDNRAVIQKIMHCN